MINVPEIVKTQRELTGRLAVTFKDDEGKELVKAFSELRAGISWPIRQLPAYLAILGLYSGAVFGKPDSLMLLYEKEYPDSILLMTDAYNRANDLRFQLFYTNRQKPSWEGFNVQFQKKIRGGLGSRDIRLSHCPFAEDFMMGKDTIRRLAQEKALLIPKASLFMRQLLDFGPEQMKVEHPENEFNAINAARYVLQGWELQAGRPQNRAGEGERQVSVSGWT